MKIVVRTLVVLLSLFVLLQFLVWLQDEYVVLQEVVSPNGKRIAVLVGNHGGGGPGYCRDLVYSFPNSNELPSITSNWAEYWNEDYLVKVVGCGDIEKLFWNNEELVWPNKGSIQDYCCEP